MIAMRKWSNSYVDEIIYERRDVAQWLFLDDIKRENKK